VRPSKSYAVDFKGKIGVKFILGFRQLSAAVTDFLAIATGAPLSDGLKSTVNASITEFDCGR
jgi:hypothetical protein